MMKLRIVMGVAAAALLAGAVGWVTSAQAQEPTEEEIAAQLILGADKSTPQYVMGSGKLDPKQVSSSPAIFLYGPDKNGITLMTTIKKAGRCTYAYTQSRDKPVMSATMTIDLNSVRPDEYPQSRPRQGAHWRYLPGVIVTCDANSKSFCEALPGGQVPAYRDMERSEFQDLFGKLKRDFCQ